MSAAIDGGAATVAAVARATRACTSCGTCRERIAGMIGEHSLSRQRAAEPVAVPAG